MKKVVLITGVSSGFGKYTAELLSLNGFIVYGTSRKSGSSEVSFNMLQMDVTNQESIIQGVDKIIQKEGRLDILINNAGMGITGSIEDASIDEAKLQMDTNFYGIVHTVSAVLPMMHKQGAGTIINFSSIGGLMGLPYQGFYSASKFAVEGYSHSLRMELKNSGINIVLINPGDFNTQFTANRLIASKTKAGSAYEAQFNKSIAIIEKDESGGLHPSLMAKKILSILGTKKPCFRYVVSTAEQKLAVLLKNILPDAWFYKIIEDHYGIK